MQTLIIILIVTMISQEILSIGVYFKNKSDKKYTAALQESIKNMHLDFINQKQRLEKIIDDKNGVITSLTYRVQMQERKIKELEENQTLIINGELKGTDTDGGVVGEKGPLPNLE
jgi:TolA-binding protein